MTSPRFIPVAVVALSAVLCAVFVALSPVPAQGMPAGVGDAPTIVAVH